MKSLILLTFFNLLVCILSFGQGSFLFEKKERPVALIEQKNQKWIVTESSIYAIQQKDAFKSISLPSVAHSAVLLDDKIYLGTDNGLKFFQLGSKKLEDYPIPNMKGNLQINKLVVDEKGSLWVGTEFNGAFELKKDGTLAQRSQISPVYTIVSTPGKVWVGTNLGLYLLELATDKWTRYAEEGYSGFELPDNYVEKLFPDKLGNLWVVMPNNLVFLTTSQEGSHFPTFDYVGSRENELYSICNLPNQSYLIASKEGIIALAAKIEAHEHEAQEEIYTRPKTKGYQVSTDLLGAPFALQQEKVLLFLEKDKLVWFLTDKGAWSIKTKTLEKNLVKLTQAKL
jgi:hypothetical protein